MWSCQRGVSCASSCLLAPELQFRGTRIKLANDATFDRLEKTIKTLASRLLTEDSVVAATDPLTSVLLGLAEPTFNDEVGNEPEWLDTTLNQSQRDAARFVLDYAVEVGLIHGPPGTGKTQTLTEVIRQLVKGGKRVLVCGASNLAVGAPLVLLYRQAP